MLETNTKLVSLILGVILFLPGLPLMAQVYQCDGVWTTSPCETKASKTILSRKEDPKYLKREKEIKIPGQFGFTDVTAYSFKSYPENTVVTATWYHKEKRHLILNQEGTNIEFCEITEALYAELEEAKNLSDVFKKFRGKESHRCPQKLAPVRKTRRDRVLRNAAPRDQYRQQPIVYTSEKILRDTEFKQRIQLTGAVSGRGRVKVSLFVEQFEDGRYSGKRLKQTRSIRLPNCGGSESYTFLTTLEKPARWIIVSENIGSYEGCIWKDRD